MWILNELSIGNPRNHDWNCQSDNGEGRFENHHLSTSAWLL